MTSQPAGNGTFSLGVMLAPGLDEADEFSRVVESALTRLAARLAELALPLEIRTFQGGHRIAASGVLDPLETLQFAIAEKLERRLNFLLILTDAEATASRLSFSVAFPSRLTNIGLISLRRLLPTEQDEESIAKASQRLERLMLHSLGHILNLGHRSDPGAVMYDFGSIEALDSMEQLGSEEVDSLRANLSIEAHDETKRGSSVSFWLRQIRSNLPVIAGTLARAHPIRLMSKLPTLLTAALSVVIVLFFSTEVWDVADAVEIYQIAIFVVLAILTSSLVLYRTFGFRTVLDRERLVSESTVVTQAATALAVTATVLAVFLLFFLLTYVAAVTIFPRQLMAEWTSIDPATDPIDHMKLSFFLAGMAVLTGALGGRGDSRRLIRTVLFLDEET